MSKSDDSTKPDLTRTGSTWTKFILSRLFFPPLLLWDALKFVMNKLFGKLVGYLILPAQQYQNLEKPSHIFHSSLNLEYKEVTTADGVKLDTFEITQTRKLPIKNQIYLIYFIGNGACYDLQVEWMIEDAKKLGCNAIAFDYRGVNRSTGQPTSSNDLVMDGIAQVKNLLDKGVKPENIILNGHSLGGAVATLVAERCHHHGQKVYLFNDRSFSTITNVVVGWIRTLGSGTGHEETLIRKLLGLIAKPFIKFGLEITQWEMHAGDAFLKLPPNYRDYIAVRSSKTDRNPLQPTAGENLQKRRLPIPVDDNVIPDFGALYKIFSPTYKNYKKFLNIKNSEHHDTAVNFVNGFKKRKMHTQSVWAAVSPHAIPLTSLRSRGKPALTASQFFYNFVNDNHRPPKAPLPENQSPEFRW